MKESPAGSQSTRGCVECAAGLEAVGGKQTPACWIGAESGLQELPPSCPGVFKTSPGQVERCADERCAPAPAAGEAGGGGASLSGKEEMKRTWMGTLWDSLVLHLPTNEGAACEGKRKKPHHTLIKPRDFADWRQRR